MLRNIMLIISVLAVSARAEIVKLGTAQNAALEVALGEITDWSGPFPDEGVENFHSPGLCDLLGPRERDLTTWYFYDRVAPDIFVVCRAGEFAGDYYQNYFLYQNYFPDTPDPILRLDALVVPGLDRPIANIVSTRDDAVTVLWATHVIVTPILDLSPLPPPVNVDEWMTRLTPENSGLAIYSVLGPENDVGFSGMDYAPLDEVAEVSLDEITGWFGPFSSPEPNIWFFYDMRNPNILVRCWADFYQGQYHQSYTLFQREAVSSRFPILVLEAFFAPGDMSTTASGQLPVVPGYLDIPWASHYRITGYQNKPAPPPIVISLWDEVFTPENQGVVIYTLLRPGLLQQMPLANGRAGRDSYLVESFGKKIALGEISAWVGPIPSPDEPYIWYFYDSLRPEIFVRCHSREYGGMAYNSYILKQIYETPIGTCLLDYFLCPGLIAEQGIAIGEELNVIWGRYYLNTTPSSEPPPPPVSITEWEQTTPDNQGLIIGQALI